MWHPDFGLHTGKTSRPSVSAPHCSGAGLLPGGAGWLERAECLAHVSVLAAGLARAGAELDSDPGAPGSGLHTAGRCSLLGPKDNQDSEWCEHYERGGAAASPGGPTSWVGPQVQGGRGSRSACTIFLSTSHTSLWGVEGKAEVTL